MTVSVDENYDHAKQRTVDNATENLTKLFEATYGDRADKIMETLFGDSQIDFTRVPRSNP